MHFTTLISTAELAREIHDPHLVVVDCRYDLGDADAGERAYRAGHLPRAQFMHIDRDLSGAKTGANGRHPLPEVSALVATLAARASTPRLKSSRTTRTTACGRRGCGGCCDGSGMK